MDIGIDSRRKLNALTLSNIAEAFEESDIPYTVEVVDFHNVSDDFKRLALKKIIKLT